MSMNWNDLINQAQEGGTYEALPPGPYQVKVASAEAKNSTNGKPMIVAKFQVLNGPYAGRLVWNNFVITSDNANALAWFFKNMASLGLDKSFFAMNPSLEATAAALVDRTCQVQLEQKTWNNEVRNDVKGITPLVQAQVTTAAPAAPVTPAAPPVEQQAAPEVQQPQTASAPAGAPPAVPF